MRAKAKRDARKEWGKLLRDIAQILDGMGEALEVDDEILGAISGMGVTNLFPLLPAHIRHLFIEQLSDEAALSAQADRLYWDSLPSKQAA